MDQTKTALERAFQLAQSGVGISDIRKHLRSEGYNNKQLEGRTIMKQLRKIIERAKADANPT